MLERRASPASVPNTKCTLTTVVVSCRYMVRAPGQDWRSRVATYLADTLGPSIVRWRNCPHSRLPPFLTASFDIACADLLGTTCAFAYRGGAEVPSPTATAKQLAHVRKALGLPVVLVEPRIPSWRRKRLIEQRVAFIAPAAQMYLPPLGIDLREVIRPEYPSDVDDPREPFAPATQVVLLSLLLEATEGGREPEAVAKAVGYSRMSISRAARALERAGLVDRPQHSRHRRLHLVDTPTSVWDRAQSHLSSPVRARYVVPATDLDGALDAGETALAHRSMLAPPSMRTVAVSATVWAGHGSRLDAQAPFDTIDDPGSMRVEVWTYPPESLSSGRSVDPLSLYLSLRDHRDDRVAQAREALPAVLA
jgi:hypothetical protein